MGPIEIGIDPVIFHIGNLGIRWYGTAILAGIVAGVALTLREARRKGIPENRIWDLAVFGMIGGLIGARLFHVIDNLETGRKENINPKAVFHLADIRNYEEIAPFFSGADYVFHLAALPRIQPAIKDPLPAHHTNTTGTLNVLRAAKAGGAKRLIYSCSSSAYGKNPVPFREDMKPDPLNPYAAQKLLGEYYCRNFTELYGLPTVVLRYFNVYGPREILEGPYATVIGIFREQLKQGKPMTMVADGDVIKRDFTHVRDVIRANILAMDSSKVGRAEVINIGMVV